MKGYIIPRDYVSMVAWNFYTLAAGAHPPGMHGLRAARRNMPVCREPPVPRVRARDEEREEL